MQLWTEPKTMNGEPDDRDPWEQLSRQEKEEYEQWSEQVEKQFTEIFGGQHERQRNQPA